MQKVKLLNIVGRPVGVITHIYCDKGFNFTPSPMYDKPLYWVRLKDGTLLKDVTDSEFERTPTPISEADNGR